MSELELVKLEGFGKEQFKHNNIIFPNFSNELLKIKQFKTRPDDVFVTAYPKSGTTWTEEIVWLIQNNLDFEKALSVSHYDRVIFLEEKPLIQSDELNSPRVFKTHLSLDYLPNNIEKSCKFVYVMRNPKDMVVSYYHFVKWIKMFSFVGNFDIIFNQFLQDQIIYGNWCEHVNQFYENSNIHFLMYEDLLEKPFETVQKIVKFLGKNYSDEEIQKLIEFTTFKKMKKNSTFCSYTSVLDQNEKEKELSLFFRKGEIGDWVNYFTEEMSIQLEEKVKNQLNPNIKIRYLPSN